MSMQRYMPVYKQLKPFDGLGIQETGFAQLIFDSKKG
jgi:hypothetical protein